VAEGEEYLWATDYDPANPEKSKKPAYRSHVTASGVRMTCDMDEILKGDGLSDDDDGGGEASPSGAGRPPFFRPKSDNVPRARLSLQKEFEVFRVGSSKLGAPLCGEGKPVLALVEQLQYLLKYMCANKIPWPNQLGFWNEEKEGDLVKIFERRPTEFRFKKFVSPHEPLGEETTVYRTSLELNPKPVTEPLYIPGGWNDSDSYDVLRDNLLRTARNLYTKQYTKSPMCKFVVSLSCLYLFVLVFSLQMRSVPIFLLKIRHDVGGIRAD